MYKQNKWIVERKHSDSRLKNKSIFFLHSVVLSQRGTTGLTKGDRGQNTSGSFSHKGREGAPGIWGNCGGGVFLD